MCSKVYCIRGFIYNQESKKTNLRIRNFTNYGSHITYRFTLRTSKPNIWFYQETDFFHYMVVLIFKFLLQVFEKCQKYHHPINESLHNNGAMMFYNQVGHQDSIRQRRNDELNEFYPPPPKLTTFTTDDANEFQADSDQSHSYMVCI